MMTIKRLTSFLPLSIKAEIFQFIECIRSVFDSFRSVKDNSLSLVRFSCYEKLERIIPSLDRPSVKVIEIGGSNGVISGFFKHANYEVAPNYPYLDVQDLSSIPDESYDIVILDQVLEHVENPMKAIKEVRRILRPGGSFIGTTPFLIYVHPVPKDYWRFTEDGLKVLLKEFSSVEIHSWGNRIALSFISYHGCNVKISDAKKHLGFRLCNEPSFPLMYLFIAKK
jgi:SAM-dependent methyltransferase